MTKARTLADNFAADINGITAGTGISGGGTSGTVTVTNSMATTIDTKGDLVVGTGADTFDKLAAGSNGDTLVADSSTATGLKWAAPSTGAESLGFTAGKNRIINGDFNVNQRSFTSLTLSGSEQYGFDRWTGVSNTGTVTYSAQTFTPGTAPVTGYEAANFARMVTSGQSASDAYAIISQKIESVRTYANQTVTVSFYAKAASGTPKVALEMQQGFGSGGSAVVNTYAGQATISTAWTRYYITVAIPSISGKTIGTSSLLSTNFWVSAGTAFNSRTGSIGVQNDTIDIWGVQVEAGSTATAFQTATGTIQGELAACQRYYYLAASGSAKAICMATYYASNEVDGIINFPVSMRTAPTLSQVTGTDYYIAYRNSGNDTFNSFTISYATNTAANIYNLTEASGTAGHGAFINTNNASSFLAFQAEL
jgi:hypothetical protein